MAHFESRKLKQQILSFFENHIDDLDLEGGAGSWPELPEFELKPRDFLDFAEADLNADRSVHALVNATANLKRAVDCQLDYFMHVVNLDSFYREKRLGIDRKLGFLKKAGIFRSRSIEKLNNLRNRLEHHYEQPKLEDVEVYFDLVSAFISVIESTLPLAGTRAELDFSLISGGHISLRFRRCEPRLELTLVHESSNYNSVYYADMASGSDPIAELEKFAYLLKVHLLLRKLDEGAMDNNRFLKELRLG